MRTQYYFVCESPPSPQRGCSHCHGTGRDIFHPLTIKEQQHCPVCDGRGWTPYPQMIVRPIRLTNERLAEAALSFNI